MAVTVKRKKIHFYPNPKRVIARFYMPVKEDRAKIISKPYFRLELRAISLIMQ